MCEFDIADMLLEELAQNSTQTSTVPAPIPPKTLQLGASVKKEESFSSVVPVPVEAGVMSPGTATRELDSIMNELLGLEPTSNPPPMAHKSMKDKKPEETKESDSGKQKEAKKPQHPPLSEKVSKNVDAIDDLLGSLSSDMEKMGVRTAAKGHCASCGKCIAGKMITALGQVWHPEHFVCTACREELGTCGFFERDGKPYYGCFLELNGRPLCSLHYHSRQGTLCGTCGEPISGRCIAALDRKFHPEHFVCAFCLRQLSQGVFKEQAGKPYCSVCHTKLFV
uniref:Leupaxin-like n=1 Tax=Sinocyclocheilus anshuiensis TaxID=1608454 RepID=A0A671KUB0_9TELE